MNIWGKLMISAGGAVVATMLVGAVGLFGMERIDNAIDTQVGVGSLLKHSCRLRCRQTRAKRWSTPTPR
jgi:hypothetical protein